MQNFILYSLCMVFFQYLNCDFQKSSRVTEKSTTQTIFSILHKINILCVELLNCYTLKFLANLKYSLNPCDKVYIFGTLFNRSNKISQKIWVAKNLHKQVKTWIYLIITYFAFFTCSLVFNITKYRALDLQKILIFVKLVLPFYKDAQ